jgi:long-subunit acyl-CoA synthetase (AMP-forming)
MRRVLGVLQSLASSELPFVEVLARDGSVARTVSYGAMSGAAEVLRRRLVELRGSAPAAGRALCVGVVCGNTPEFIAADLACLAGRATEVPVPLAFSRAQAASLLCDVDVCVYDREGEARLAEWGGELWRAGCVPWKIDLEDLLAGARDPLALGSDVDEWICKTIHTSGTTSQPKGVRIRALGLDALMTALQQEMPAAAFRRYLSLVPFSLLIEQVTGLYMVILHRGIVTLLPADMALVGTAVAAASDVMPFLRASRPTALVATPVLVDAMHQVALGFADRAGLSAALFGSDTPPLLCCGGAPVDMKILAALDDKGIPVYEGYGLSENGSVVSWNRPGARRIGSVGTPLPHVQVWVAEDGELLVKSTSLFAGYTREDPSSCAVDAEGWLHTGDLARIDDDGFVYITGRKKNVIITSTGRNVAPEWVEAQYARLPFVQAVAVVGNGFPALHGLFLVDPDHDLAAAAEAVFAFGASQLSEVERVQVVHLRHAQESDYRQFFTVTGRPIRNAIGAAIQNGALGAFIAEATASGA